MLAADDLLTVFAFFDRNCLDPLELVSKHFHGFVRQNFAEFPIRYVSCTVAEDGSVELSRRAGFYNETISTNVILLPTVLRSSVVKDLRFEGAVSMELLEGLLPARDRFRQADCMTPSAFATIAAYNRAFDELLFCDKLFVHSPLIHETGQDISQSGALFLTPCIQSAKIVSFADCVGFDESFMVALVDWLHAGTKKRFMMKVGIYGYYNIDNFLAHLEPVIKEKFRTATSPAPFELEFVCDAYDNDEDTREDHENAATNEKLTVWKGVTTEATYKYKRVSLDGEKTGEWNGVGVDVDVSGLFDF